MKYLILIILLCGCTINAPLGYYECVHNNGQHFKTEDKLPKGPYKCKMATEKTRVSLW